MLIAWSLALSVNVTHVNDDVWKKPPNGLKNLHKKIEKQLDDVLDNFHKARRHHLYALILAIASLTVSVLSSFFLSRPLNALAQVVSTFLLIFAFMLGLHADTLSISIFISIFREVAAAILNLWEDINIVTIEALRRSKVCPHELTSTSSGQPCSTLINRLARRTMNELAMQIIDLYVYPLISTSYLDLTPTIRIFNTIEFGGIFFYTIEFGGIFNATFNLATRVLGLSIQLQPLLSAFSLIVPISASILLGLSQWGTSTVVGGLLESSCKSIWLEMLKEVRKRVFMNFMIILLIYIFSFYLIPMSLTPSTGAFSILWDSLYFGSGLGLLASLALELMLLTSFRDFMHLTCSLGQTQENRG